MLTAVTAAFVQHEVAGGPAVQQRNTAYLIHAVTSGAHPRLGELLAQAAPPPADPAEPADQADPAATRPTATPTSCARFLAGLLEPSPGPAPSER